MFSSDLWLRLLVINISAAAVLYIKAVHAIGHSCLINYWHTKYPTENNTSSSTVNTRSSGWLRHQFSPQAWPPGWEASGIVMRVWDRTTKQWSFWVRTTTLWETGVSKAGDCSRIICSRVRDHLWDSRSLDQDPPRPMESAGWDRRWVTQGESENINRPVYFFSFNNFTWTRWCWI